MQKNFLKVMSVATLHLPKIKPFRGAEVLIHQSWRSAALRVQLQSSMLAKVVQLSGGERKHNSGQKERICLRVLRRLCKGSKTDSYTK